MTTLSFWRTIWAIFPVMTRRPWYGAISADEAIALLDSLAGTLTQERMQALNASVKFDGRTFAQAAVRVSGHTRNRCDGRGGRFLGRFGGEHGTAPEADCGVALIAAVLAGVGAALAVFRHAAVARAVIYFCGLLQTIPSIALLALMIPLFGIGVAPAIVALFLYSLLPILRNTVTALTTVDPTLRRVAVAMGLSEIRAPAPRLRAAVAAEHAGWNPHRRGHQYRHGDIGRVHRRGWAGRSHRDRAGVE